MLGGWLRQWRDQTNFSSMCPFCWQLWLEPGGEEGVGLDDGGVAFGAGGDHADFDLEEVGDEFQVVDGGLGEFGAVFEAVGGFVPSWAGICILELRVHILRLARAFR